MQIVGIHEAKTNLSKLLDRVLGGEEVIIAKSGKPIAKIICLLAPRKKRLSGQDRGRGFVSGDFTGPLPPAVMKFFLK